MRALLTPHRRTAVAALCFGLPGLASSAASSQSPHAPFLCEASPSTTQGRLLEGLARGRPIVGRIHMIVSQTGIVEAPSAGFLFVSDHRRMAGVMLVAFDPGTLSAVFRLPTGDESRPFVQVPEAGWADIALSFRRGVLRATVNGRTATRWVGWRLPPRPALLCGSGRFTFALAPGVRPSRRRY